MKKRNGTVDVFRLLYALVIVTGHSVTVGVTSPFPFEPVGILVEFFLFLTGYFTCVSFSGVESDCTTLFIDSLKYTYKKFKVFIPFVITSVGLSYSINFISMTGQLYRGGLGTFCKNIYNMFLEMFLLNYAFSELGQRVGALYFLSALLIVFPAFCAFCKLKSKNIKCFVALYVMLFYYHDIDAAITATYPWVLLRMVCGLCTGMLIYYIVQSIKNKKCIQSRISMFVAVLFLSVPLILSGLHISDRRISLICEFIGLIIALSNSLLCSYSSKLTNNFAKLSMVVYIFHWSIGQNISYYVPAYSIRHKLVLYYAYTMLISVISLFIVEICAKRLNKNVF